MHGLLDRILEQDMTYAIECYFSHLRKRDGGTFGDSESASDSDSDSLNDSEPGGPGEGNAINPTAGAPSALPTRSANQETLIVNPKVTVKLSRRQRRSTTSSRTITAANHAAFVSFLSDFHDKSCKFWRIVCGRLKQVIGACCELKLRK
jgi:hypothetical protein